MKKCKKHQWDYIGNYRIGNSLIMLKNYYYAVWLCPYCNAEKRSLLEYPGVLKE